ncbi:hypothetical protein OIDMADRAFT_180887 [Oidiodendron maius Zn]|uniref:PHD-type domain-containing protein n=1 Tax=Oidiodendron maius (strain Zn) TaxID=913774 RepID=A0A0C3HC63_OIDMZ|nr:hypothetical protein OIDMADRAFT_180887 [Oidiodendron maius Zn]
MEVLSQSGRAAKRPRPNPTQQRRRSPSTRQNTDSHVVSQNSNETASTTPLSKEERRSLWLAVLTREELERVAAGIDWHHDPHSNICFVCKKPGSLLNCLSCPRSYHQECLDPTRSAVAQAERWACPACSILYAHEPIAPTTTTQLPEPSELSNPQSGVRDDLVVEEPEGTILVDNARPENMSDSNTSKEGQHASSTQPTYASNPKSSNPSSISSRSNLPGGMSNESGTPNRLLRGKLPNHSLIDPHIFNHAGSKTPHHYSNASSKLEQGGLKKRSRYSTLPTEVDEALAIINRQLEVASHSKSMLEQATTRLHILEQDLMIERGKATLTAIQNDKDTEINTLKDELKLKQDMIDELTQKTEELLGDIRFKDAKIKDLEDWKMRMKMMIDGN